MPVPPDMHWQSPLWMPNPKPGNEVTFLYGGDQAYAAMADSLYRVGASSGTNRFIYHLNWWVNYDLKLQLHGNTLRDYWYNANHVGCMIRALFWNRTMTPTGTREARDVQARQNSVEVNYINGLPNGHAISDGRHNLFGSHHQKLLLVYGPNEQNQDVLTAYVGGIDFNYDRVFTFNEQIWGGDPLDTAGYRLHPGDSNGWVQHYRTLSGAQWSAGAPLLDVHARIRGPAAYDLLDIFLSRYADNPESQGKTIIAPVRDYHTARGNVTVRVCSTFGNRPNAVNSALGDAIAATGEGTSTFTPDERTRQAIIHGSSTPITITGATGTSMTNTHTYYFAPQGRQSGRAQVIYAIRSARRSIYFEDQYVISSEIAGELRNALANNPELQVLAVLPHQTISTDYTNEPAIRRSRFFDILSAAPNSAARVKMYCPIRPQDPPATRYQYVHSKVFIFDDEFCTVGSMNNNFRSTTNDSELNCGFYEPGGLGAAHNLRLDLWARHLGVEGHRERLPADWAGGWNLFTHLDQYPAGSTQTLSIGGQSVTPMVETYRWTHDPEFNQERVRWYDPTLLTWDLLHRGSNQETLDQLEDPHVASSTPIPQRPSQTTTAPPRVDAPGVYRDAAMDL